MPAGKDVAKTRSLKPVNAIPASLPGSRARGVVLAAVLLLLIAALAIRAYWQFHAHVGTPSPPPLVMDDSSFDLPLSPPPMPPDNAAPLRAAKYRLDSLAKGSSTQDRQQLASAALDAGDLWRAKLPRAGF